MRKNDSLPYNPVDAKSIVEYARVLVGSTLREHIDADEIADPHRRKGSFGNAMETCYFHYNINSDSNPDFPEAGIELKTTPLKKDAQGRVSSKERLVISMINYMDIVKETWETSSLLHKASSILLISYLYEKDKDPLDYEIKLATLWGLPEEDMPVFKQDWETIVSKVRAGRAHEISGSDTLYLEACTKAADSSIRRPQPFSTIQAKPRAWALKSSYMTVVSNGLLEDMESIRRRSGEHEMNLLELIRKRFSPYIDWTEDELAAEFGYGSNGCRKPKNLCALITKRILGVNENLKIAEFEKAGIKPKTIRVRRNDKPKEAMSFPHFDYFDVAETAFEGSSFKGYLDAKYLFVIYREDEYERDVYRLSEVMFWQMDDEDMDEARRCYELMAERIRSGRADWSVGSTENRCCHVRPHARDKKDTLMTPHNGPMVKKCFWLNISYLAEQIAAGSR